MPIIIICYHCSNPGPIEMYGKLGKSPGLVNITGHGPEEIWILMSITQTGTASCITNLKKKVILINTYTYKYTEIYSTFNTGFYYIAVLLESL